MSQEPVSSKVINMKIAQRKKTRAIINGIKKRCEETFNSDRCSALLCEKCLISDRFKAKTGIRLEETLDFDVEFKKI